MEDRVAEPVRAFAFAEARPLVVARWCSLVGRSGVWGAFAVVVCAWVAHYFLTYADRCGLAQYVTHPVTICELRPGTGLCGRSLR